MGAVAIFISSKYEDVIPIFMQQLVSEACHGKYEASVIVEQEKKILQSLNFKI